MGRFIQKHDGKGSLRNIQVLINKNQDIIDNRIKSSFYNLVDQGIIWASPLENDDYAEYRDNDFLKKVGLDPEEINLNEFWPKGGTQWDALAITDDGHIILVEAKASIPEIISNPSKAGEESKRLIDKSLNETKAYLGIIDNADWSSKLYQYTNRLAHLYYLRVKCKKQAFLVNIYFIGDETVSGPKTKEEWDDANNDIKSYLGISSHKLSEYITDIFIDINELKQ